MMYLDFKKRSQRNQSGFTLIEVLIAMTIIAVALLGLGGLVTTTIHNNMKNELRDLSLRLSAETAAALKTQPFDQVVSGDLDPYEDTNPALGQNYRLFPNPMQSVRNGQQTFEVAWEVDSPSADLKQISIAVKLKDKIKGQDFLNNTTIYRSRGL